MSATTQCERCGVDACGGDGNPDARIFRRAQHGVCVNCGVVLFLQRLANMQTSHMNPAQARALNMDSAQVDAVNSNPFGGFAESLRLVHIQECLARVMRAGKSDAHPGEIDWERVIELWDIDAPPKGGLW